VKLNHKPHKKTMLSSARTALRGMSRGGYRRGNSRANPTESKGTARFGSVSPNKKGQQSQTLVPVISSSEDESNTVLYVKPGYARNFLIPQQKAVYARQSPSGLLDTATTASASVSSFADADSRAADVLRHYLRNKTVRLSFSAIERT
jgi:Ribosomal protein L9, N-terminal domain